LTAEDEDDGVEKQPSNKIRADRDVHESAVAAGVQRNLVACVAEVEDGEVWNRTADWTGMLRKQDAPKKDQPTDTIDVLDTLLVEARRRGLVPDVEEPLVEPFCGSCGRKRGADTRSSAEPALLYTHHPTAPPIEVRFTRLLRADCVNPFTAVLPDPHCLALWAPFSEPVSD